MVCLCRKKNLSSGSILFFGLGMKILACVPPLFSPATHVHLIFNQIIKYE